MLRREPKRELKRLVKISRIFETKARSQGYRRIAGVDEAGRGPLAGPVVAAACILSEHGAPQGVDDSKKLTPLARYRLYEELINESGSLFAVGVVDSLRIDQINILQATFEAMLIAVASLKERPDYLLVDGNQMPPSSFAGEAIVDGDALSESIAAASIIAKETRDRMMREYHERWPEYGFDQHKGYCTEKHLEKLAKHGPCPIHRHSFEPVRSVAGVS